MASCEQLRTMRSRRSIACLTFLALLLVSCSNGLTTDTDLSQSTGAQAPGAQLEDERPIGPDEPGSQISPEYSLESSNSDWPCLSVEVTGIDVELPAVETLGAIESWIAVDEIQATHIDSFGYLVAAVSPASSAPDGLIVPKWLPLYQESLGARHAGLLLGRIDPETATHVLIRADDGGLTLLDRCETMDAGMGQLDQFGSRLSPSLSGSAVLAALVEGGPAADELRAGLEQHFSRQPPDWRAQDPLARIVDEEETPPDVLATLDDATIRVWIPEAWHGSVDAVICTRIDLGWNECAALDMLEELARTGGALEMYGYVPNEGVATVTISLLNGTGSLDGPRLDLGSIQVRAADTPADGVAADVVLASDTTPDRLLGGAPFDVQLTELG